MEFKKVQVSRIIGRNKFISPNNLVHTIFILSITFISVIGTGERLFNVLNNI